MHETIANLRSIESLEAVRRRLMPGPTSADKTPWAAQ